MEESSFADVIRDVRSELKMEPLSPVQLNRAAARIDQLGRRLHGVGWVRGHEMGGCLTAAVRELSQARGLAEVERAASVQEAMRQLDAALALTDQGLHR